MSAVEQRIAVEYVSTDSVRPNDWNPNEVDARTYEAIRESVTKFGFLLPVLVRSDKKGWLIADGEHRHRIAQELGLTEIPVIAVDHLSDADFKKLTVIMNETRGQADTVPLARLLSELAKDTTLDELLIGLPYEQAQLEELLKIGQIDWDAFNADRSDEVEQHLRLARGKNQFTVFLNFDEKQKEKYDTFTEMLAREKGENYTVEQAVVDGLAVLCQSL